MASNQKVIKCVVVGDGAVGKTCMCMSYMSNKFPTQYVPTVFDSFAVTVVINDEPYMLSLFDTAGQEEYDRLRPIAYPDANIFLVCFSVVNPDSMDNVKANWVPEINHYCPKTPFLLVGTQIDLREDPSIAKSLEQRRQRVVTYERGQKTAQEVKAHKYVECSALTQKGLKNVFDEAIMATIRPPKPAKTRNCLIL